MEDNSSQQQDSKQLTEIHSAGKEESTPGLRREAIGRADKVYDKKTRKWRLHKQSQRQKSQKSERFERFVIVSARIFTLQGYFSGRYEVYIRGRLLCDELGRIYSPEYVEFPLNKQLSNTSLRAMYHALPILRSRLDSLDGSDKSSEHLRFELNAGIAFTNEYWGPTIDDQKSTPKGFVKFDALWTLFSPGCLLYSVDTLKEPRCYRLLACDYEKTRHGDEIFNLKFDHLDYDELQIGYRVRRHTIGAYRLSMRVQDLPLYPLSMHPECDKVRKQLLQRAEKAFYLKGRHIQNYHGHALEYNRHIQKFNSNGRVMIDPVLYNKLRANDLEKLIINQDYHGISFEPMKEDILYEDQKITMNSMAYGYCLRNKTWGAFAVSRLSDVIWDASILNSVEIDSTKKDFLQALVESHIAQKANSFDDIVRDKGKGLVGLLCGPPGVGKTLTAEAVAEVAKRPLMVVSSGEIGSNVGTVEKRLRVEIELAEAWNAVLLLDEADVFMAERDDNHIERNAITSVFLRELEYYRGIILLTTNRLKSIDSAFQSRIHFFFHYNDLDLRAKAQVWKTFLDKAEAAEGIRVDVTDEQRQTLALHDFNGRQIKNIVSTTRLYALRKKQPITMELLQMAIGFSQSVSPTTKRKRSVEPEEDEQLPKKRQRNGDVRF